MDLNLNSICAENYHSNTQIARILTENWVAQNMYCPRCGNLHIEQFENNRPVADFFCPHCHNEYELKSKGDHWGHKITAGSYDTMMERIASNNNPDFFFLCYSKSERVVKDFIIIPKHFFTPDVIEKRKPLAQTARRAGWIGCNILIDKIPKQGKIAIISSGQVLNPAQIVKQLHQSNQLKINNIENRGWMMDILKCINDIPTQTFLLDEIYAYENILKNKHPQNNHIRPKIRQQLQYLRNKGVIAFLGGGSYKKII